MTNNLLEENTLKTLLLSKFNLKDINNYPPWILGGFFFILSSILHFHFLNQSEFATGWDSYFYIIQIKSFFEEGKMHSNDVSLIYPFYFCLYFLIENYELSFKIGSALLVGLYTLSLFSVGLEKSKSTAFLLVSWSLASPHLTYFSSQYPKNLLGLCFFIFFIYFLQKRNWKFSILFFILNIFAHRMSIFLCMISLGVFLLSQIKNKKFLLLIPILLTLVLFIGFFFKGILNIHDFERFNGILSSKPSFIFHQFLEIFNFSTLWKSELIILLLIAIFVLFKRGKNDIEKMILSIFLIFIFPFYHCTLDNLIFRLCMALFLLLPLLLPLIFTKKSHIYTIAFSLFIISFFSASSYVPKKHDPPYLKYQRMCKKLPKKDIELIIVHKGFAEYLTFYTGIDALPWQVEYKVNSEKLWRIVHKIDYQYFVYHLKDSPNYQRLSFDYTLIREDFWQELVKKMENENDKMYLEHTKKWYNPHVIRPQYLLKNK